MQFLTFIGTNARWLGGGFLLCFFSSFGQTFFVSLSNGDIRRDYDLTNGEFGMIYMLATLASAATLPFLGWTLDRYPAWRVAAVTVVCLAIATLAMAVSSSVPLLILAIYLLRLFGQGMMTEISMTTTGRWFAANRGRAMALVTLGNHAGTGFFPLIFVLAAGAFGWRGTWVASAAILILVALPTIVALVHRERDPQSEPPGTPIPNVADWTMAEVLRSPRFYLVSMSVLAPPFIGTTLFFHQVYLTELRGWSLEVFAAGFAVMSAVTVVFALVCGWMVDRYSALKLLPYFLIPLAIACFIAANFTAEAAIFVFMICLGVSNGFSSTLLGALWPELYGVKHLGAIRSLTVALMVLASALGPGVTGILIDLGVPYPLQIDAMGLYCLVMTIAMALLAGRLAPKANLGNATAPGGVRTVDRIDPQPHET
ncbi:MULTISPECIES: MFS transporter [Aurantimonas]|uniref:MFS transporter n=1 Tax=Aurantimonas TaxID=182269 RepID=UPI001652AACC|nr:MULTISPECIES: MFS transporter [Aurantimonas]MBC6717522.1 MFS transporter [Aurantimonas sp. DM33-3]MCD1642117.1 MFS transporter [Aurantimonas coralicida]